MQKNRAVIYARYSAGPQQTEQSLEGQIRVCKKFIKDKGLVLMRTYEDRHITGTTDNRPAFQEMVRDAEAGAFDAVVVYSSDRFSRNKYDSVVYKAKLRKLGVGIYYAAENIPEGPEGILMESMMEGWAQYYSAELSRKVTRGLKESAKKGKTTGPLPYGYTRAEDKSIIVDEDRALIVKKIFSDFVSGKTKAEIIQELTDLGVKTQKGHDPGWNMITTILSNPKYVGKGTYDGEPAPYPQIIDNQTWHRAQGRLRKKQSRKPRGDFKLTGKLFCGVCGERFSGISGTARNGRIHYYYHTKCKHFKNIRCDDIEKLVADRIREFFQDPIEKTKVIDKINALQQKENASGRVLDAQNKKRKALNTEAENIMKHIAKGTESERLMNRLKEIDEVLIPEIDIRISEIQAMNRSLDRSQIEKAFDQLLKKDGDAVFDLVHEIYVMPDQINIVLPIIEKAQMKEITVRDINSMLHHSRVSSNTFAASWGFVLELPNHF